ncbi:sensor histidine kinase, partial [Thermodesulfobacteriota bacterium]
LSEEEREKLAGALLQSKKMEAVGIMAGVIAHDFNNLLVGILGYGGLALNEISKDDVQYEYISQILETSEKASALVQKLLAFSSRQFLRPERLNLNEKLNNIKAKLNKLVGTNIIIIMQAQDLLWDVMFDPGQLEEIAVNLATNAKDAMPNGGTLRIRTENIYCESEMFQDKQDMKSGEYVRLTFLDNGEGMSEETLKKIFDPFFTTKNISKASGMGLSIIHGVVIQSGGYIDAESTLGEGTSIRIFIPRAE